MNVTPQTPHATSVGVARETVMAVVALQVMATAGAVQGWVWVRMASQ